MAKAKGLADLVAAGVTELTRRTTWWDYLPDDAKAELLDVRQRFQAGEYGNQGKALTVARTLVPHCEARGWRIACSKRVAEWLRQKS